MNSDKEQKLGLVRRDHCDDETVTGSGVGMGARGRAGLHKSVRMPHCAAYSLSRTFAGRLSHTRKYFANDRLIAAVIQLQIGVRHFERSDGPAIAKAHKWRSRESGIGRVEAEAICHGNQLFTREICSQFAKIGIARDRDGGHEVQFPMWLRPPATGGFTPADMCWKLILVTFRIGERREGFDERAKWDGLGGVLPTGRQKGASAGIEEKIRDITAGEFTFENENGGLAKKRLRRCGRILSRN